MNDQTTNLQQLKTAIQNFRSKRGWHKEDPKDIAIGLSLEANEVLDIFQWRTEEEIMDKPNAKEGIADEMADVLFYLGMMANRLDIDLVEAFNRKMRKNESKYPESAFVGKTAEDKRRAYYKIKARHRGSHPLAEIEAEKPVNKG